MNGDNVTKETKKKKKRAVMAYCHILVSASHAVCRGYAHRPGHAIDSHKIGKNASLLGMHALGRSLTVLPDSVKGRIVCGTVYSDMHFKDLLRSIVRVGYLIPVPDFYLMLHAERSTL